MAKLIENSRYLLYIAVLSLLLATVGALGWGIIKTVSALRDLALSLGQDPYAAVRLIEVIDSFLIAIALFMFAAGTYELFIGKTNLPAQVVPHDLRELKDKLGGTIVLVMVVTFLEHLVEWDHPTDSLLFALAVAIVSGALIGLSYFSAGKES
jgi:uncharacterized membrane protein YqhA